MMTIDASPELQEKREAIKRNPDCRTVEADEFCQFMVSNRKLLRFDHPAAMLRGLLDPDQGVQFVVEEEKLLEFQVL